MPLDHVFKMSKWTETDVKNFLKLYQSHECLWNPKIEAYRSQSARDNAIEEIIRDFGKPGFSPFAVKIKIKNFRSAYSRELGKIIRSKKSGVGKDHLYKPQLVWFDLADSFLRKVTEARGISKSTLNFKNESTHDDEGSGLNDLEVIETSSRQQSDPKQQSSLLSKIRLLKPCQPKCSNKTSIKEVISKLDSTVTRSKADEIELFRKNVASQLHQLENIYKPTLNWFATADRFLRNIVEPRSSKTNHVQSPQGLLIREEVCDEDEALDTITVDANESSSFYSKSKTLTEKATLKRHSERQNSEAGAKKQQKFDRTAAGDAACAHREIGQLHSSSATIFDEYAMFGQTVAGHLRRLPVSIGLECQAYIMDYLIQQRLNNLPQNISTDGAASLQDTTFSVRPCPETLSNSADLVCLAFDETVA